MDYDMNDPNMHEQYMADRHPGYDSYGKSTGDSSGRIKALEKSAELSGPAPSDATSTDGIMNPAYKDFQDKKRARAKPRYIDPAVMLQTGVH